MEPTSKQQLLSSTMPVITAIVGSFTVQTFLLETVIETAGNEAGSFTLWLAFGDLSLWTTPLHSEQIGRAHV